MFIKLVLATLLSYTQQDASNTIDEMEPLYTECFDLDSEATSYKGQCQSKIQLINSKLSLLMNHPQYNNMIARRETEYLRLTSVISDMDVLALSKNVADIQRSTAYLRFDQQNWDLTVEVANNAQQLYYNCLFGDDGYRNQVNILNGGPADWGVQEVEHEDSIINKLEELESDIDLLMDP